MKNALIKLAIVVYNTIWFVYSKILKQKVVYKTNKLSFLMYPKGHIPKLILRERFFGKFEHNERLFVEESLNLNSCVLNIGSNIGFYTLMCSALAKNGQIFSFEPSSKNFFNLKSNVSLNSFSNITLFNFGLGENEGEVSLYKDANHPNLDSHYTVVNDYFDNSILEKIQIKRLDSFLSELPSIDFIIIDVEGYELEVLKGASEFLKKNNNSIYLIETTKNHEKVVEIMKFYGLYPFTILNNGILQPATNFHGNLVFKRN